ncbi:MAG: T9SS type A sorting domain-containing protein, partial [Chitinophagales bacterium]
SLDPCCPNGCGSSNSQCNTGAVTPPLGQPIQKSYRDWNAGWPQDSWSTTENAIYTQAAYVKLLSWFLGGACNAFSEKEKVSLQKVSLLLYPNPAGDIITVDADDYNNEPVNIRIYSLEGRIWMEENNVRLPLQISLDHLLSGNYVVMVHSNWQVLTGKFLKQ